MTSDIDFVVLWVDGSDPAWLAEKNKHMGLELNESNSINRFRDWGLMKYWFRAIEKYTPWVRKIHFVTWGHIPDFLNVDHPKLNIVAHNDFIPSKYLPLFNAPAIEMNIHRIKGLSEKFVYFNDDMFILRPLKEDDFFIDSLPRGYYAELPASFCGFPKEWEHMVINDLGIINKHFSKKESIRRNRRKFYSPQFQIKDNARSFILENINPDAFTGFKNFHCPAAFRKEIFSILWNEEYDAIDKTCKHRFRDNSDVNQWLVLWWQLVSGKFIPRYNSSKTFSISSNNIMEIVQSIKKQKYEMICLNDSSETIDFGHFSRTLQDAFAFILPEISEYEI